MIILLWVISITCTVLVSRTKGRNPYQWFFIAVLFGPLGLLGVLLIGADKESLDQADIASGKKKKCPDCAETIKFEAKVCRYCNAHQVSITKNSKVFKDNPALPRRFCKVCHGVIAKTKVQCSKCNNLQFD
ncbi:hypothetical protein [Vibrio coralliirubri]|uniref:hypothetical protein n=1 Tax=Vibrio coralliirubri TaxID=1516159 RepID=UPI002FE204D6